MKKIALLTSSNTDEHVMHESLLEESLNAYPDLKHQTLNWDDDSINWSEFSAVIVRTTWDYTKRPEEFLRVLKKISETGALLLNSYDLLKWNMNKIYLRDLSKKGVSIIESLFFDEEDFNKQAESFVCEQFIVKPRVGASAEGQEFVTLDRLIEMNESKKYQGSHFAQPFIEDIKTEGECSYFFFNNKFVYAIKKVPKAGDFRVQEEFGGRLSAFTPDEEELKEAYKTADAVKNFSPLYLRVDALKTKAKEWKLMELEAIEPSMYFGHFAEASNMFSKALISRVGF